MEVEVPSRSGGRSAASAFSRPMPTGWNARAASGHVSAMSAKTVGFVALAGLLIGSFLIGSMIHAAASGPPLEGQSYVAGFDSPAKPLDKILGAFDGQSYAQLARDPTLAHPWAFRQGPAQAAYRAQRPALGYLAFIFSAGRSSAVPDAMVVIAILACGFAAVSVALLSRPWVGLLALLMPGAVASSIALDPEVLGLGFAALGVYLWLRHQRGAVVMLCLAGLTRETYLLIPVAIFVWERRAVWLTPVGAWIAWVSVVRLRFGAWPATNGSNNIAAPFVGLMHGARAWGSETGLCVVTLALGLGLVIAAIARAPRSPFTFIAAVYLGLLVFLGNDVWTNWRYFSRPLLPMYAFSLAALFAAQPIAEMQTSRSRR